MLYSIAGRAFLIVYMDSNPFIFKVKQTSWTTKCRRQRDYNHSKCQKLLAKGHRVTSQKTWILSYTVGNNLKPRKQYRHYKLNWNFLRSMTVVLISRASPLCQLSCRLHKTIRQNMPSRLLSDSGNRREHVGGSVARRVQRTSSPVTMPLLRRPARSSRSTERPRPADMFYWYINIKTKYLKSTSTGFINTSAICVISGFRREVAENCGLTSYHAASSGPIFKGQILTMGPIG